eukprot:scaffold477_cov355-Pinguiococcus_pyrenoidosus.AAC.13
MVSERRAKLADEGFESVGSVESPRTLGPRTLGRLGRSSSTGAQPPFDRPEIPIYLLLEIRQVEAEALFFGNDLAALGTERLAQGAELLVRDEGANRVHQAGGFVLAAFSFEALHRRAGLRFILRIEGIVHHVLDERLQRLQVLLRVHVSRVSQAERPKSGTPALRFQLGHRDHLRHRARRDGPQEHQTIDPRARAARFVGDEVVAVDEHIEIGGEGLLRRSPKRSHRRPTHREHHVAIPQKKGAPAGAAPAAQVDGPHGVRMHLQLGRLQHLAALHTGVPLAPGVQMPHRRGHISRRRLHRGLHDGDVAKLVHPRGEAACISEQSSLVSCNVIEF